MTESISAPNNKFSDIRNLVRNLIRSIQRAEGNPDCFQRAGGHCDRMDCAWREYCLEGHHNSEGKET